MRTVVAWALLGPFRGMVVIAVCLHVAALGGVLISGFWSVVNERFDPRTAKRYVGRIAAGGTAGGLVGGLLAERISTLGEIGPMFPALAALHLVCAALILVVRDRVAKGILEKKTVEQIVASKPTADYDARVGNAAMSADRFVQQLYAEMAPKPDPPAAPAGGAGGRGGGPGGAGGRAGGAGRQ